MKEGAAAAAHTVVLGGSNWEMGVVVVVEGVCGWVID